MHSVGAILLLTVLLTSILSGVLGMGGGLILIGVYAIFLSIPATMVLHGVTQLAANGFRTYLFRQHLYLPVLGRYFLGVFCSLGLVASLGLVLDKTSFYLVLGALPFVSLLPKLPQLDFTKPGHAFICGAITTFSQLTAGVSGPLLDIFFLKTPLDRFQVIGTKALTQSAGHLLKIVYFAKFLPLGAEGSEIPWWLFPTVIIASFAGTALGKKLLAFLDEHRFRQACTGMVLIIGTVYLVRGFNGLAA